VAARGSSLTATPGAGRGHHSEESRGDRSPFAQTGLAGSFVVHYGVASSFVPGELVRVGLFPLPDTVLFPGMRLPLHVFEPRYLRLVEDSIERGVFLAVPRLKAGYEASYYDAPPVHSVAGVGRIVEHVRLADGRYEVELEGLARVELVREIAQQPYRLAEARVLADGALGFDSSPLHAELARLLRELRPFWSDAGERLERAALDQPSLGARADALAQLFEASKDRQQLLEELDAGQRAMMICARLHELKSQIERLGKRPQPATSRPN
jgi:Lon protease-like protein